MWILFHFLLKIAKSPLTIAFSLFLIFQLQLFNIHIDFRDEGFLTYNAMRIMQGEIPYRDFFLTTTPGTFYIQAFLMHIFGNYLILARLLYIIIILGILFLVSRIYKFNQYNNNMLLSVLGLTFVSPAYAFYNIEGLFLFLLSLYIITRITKNQPHFYFVLLGIITALLFLIKQSYGMANIAAILFSFYIFLPRNVLIKNALIYLGSFCSIIGAYCLYFSFNHAFSQFLYYTLSFSKEVKGHRAPFIITSLTLIPLYFIVLQILKRVTIKQKAYIAVVFIAISCCLYFLIAPDRVGRLLVIIYDPLIYYYLILFFLPLTLLCIFLKTKNTDEKKLITISFFSLVLFLASAASGRDFTTVLMVSPFFLPLLIFVFQKFIKQNLRFVIPLALLLYTLPFHLATLNQIKISIENTSYLKSIPQATGIKISSQEAEEIRSMVAYVKTSTKPSDTIICFPYCPLLFFLTERNSTSYFSFYYPETFRANDQKIVIEEIKIKKPTMVIIQRKGTIEQEADFENKRLAKLKNYFFTNYQRIKTTTDFDFYIPR